MKNEICNAKIYEVTLTMADHGCLTFYIFIEGKSFGCGIGGYWIGHGYLGSDHFDGLGKGLEVMMKIMNVVGVEKWEDLKGKYVRFVDPGLGGSVTKIGNIIENKWVDIKEEFSKGD